MWMGVCKCAVWCVHALGGWVGVGRGMRWAALGCAGL